MKHIKNKLRGCLHSSFNACSVLLFYFDLTAIYPALDEYFELEFGTWFGFDLDWAQLDHSALKFAVKLVSSSMKNHLYLYSNSINIGRPFKLSF